MSRAIGLFALLAAAACASAQVTLSTVQGGVATPAGQAYPFGSVALGTVADVEFQLTNTGSSAVHLSYLNVNVGDGHTPSPYFSLTCPLPPDLCGPAPPQLPYLISPTGTLDFTVYFEPLQLGSPSGAMTICAAAVCDGNEISVFLNGTGVPVPPALTLLQGNPPLAAPQTISFGNVQVGSSKTIALKLANQTDVLLPIPAITLTGGDFSISGPALSATSVQPGSSAELDAIFTPTAPVLQQATLRVGLNTYTLQGTGLPVFPVPSIQWTPATLASAQQGSLSVSLASASASATPADAPGTVTLAFQSAVSGVADDPTITFADGTRSATFTVAAGKSAGQFAAGPSVAFGTGTTAGTLVFTVTLGSNPAQTTNVTIPAAAIGIDAAVAARNVSCDPSAVYCTTTNIQLQINGWDNTRSASQLAFTFFNSSGAQISPGPITVAAGSAFQQYFASSDMAGVFGLTAFFSVTGDSDDVVAAVVQLTNSAGAVESAQITF